MALEVGAKVYLRLHQVYTIPGLSNRKLSNQRVGPFKVLEKVRHQAYRLELPPLMKIYPVVSIAQLEPATPGNDPYNRPFNSGPRPVIEEDDKDTDEDSKPYEIETLLKKRPGKDL